MHAFIARALRFDLVMEKQLSALAYYLTGYIRYIENPTHNWNFSGDISTLVWIF